MKKNNETDFDGGGIELQRAYLYSSSFYYDKIYLPSSFSAATQSPCSQPKAHAFSLQSSPVQPSMQVHCMPSPQEPWPLQSSGQPPDEQSTRE